MSSALTVLLVSGEPAVRKQLEKDLSELGCKVISRSTGQELLAALASPPNLIVADVVTPEAHAFEVARLCNERRQAPVILISDCYKPEVLRQASDITIMAYLIKPISKSDLKVAIAVTLARFAQYQQACAAATDLHQALEERILVDRAKGAVMRRLQVDEQDAFRRLKKLASDGNSKLADVARRVLEAEIVYREMDRY